MNHFRFVYRVVDDSGGADVLAVDIKIVSRSGRSSTRAWV